jgi:phosphatidylethanolamine-binding protein (PEBP) family uncharacterized protein
MSLERGTPPDPFDVLPAKPWFRLESDDIADGTPLALTFVHDSAGGENLSPHLHWSGFPAETKSFAVTCYDPADVTELARGAGTPSELPAGAFHVPGDMGTKAYAGAAPPSGDRPHRYVFAVHALDVDKLDLDDSVRPAIVGFNLAFHTLARGALRPTYQT